MRSLVILALLGCACASPLLQYTPEVVAERARFQQLYNAAAAAAAAAPDPVPSGTGFHHQQAPAFSHHQQAPATFTTKWAGPVAATVPAGLPGSDAQVMDTADVAQARNAFLAAYRAQVAATTGKQAPAQTHFAANQVHHSAPQPAFRAWSGPVATNIPAGVNGKVTPVADTADVAAARSAFFAAYNKALSNSQRSAKSFGNSQPAARAFSNSQPTARAFGNSQPTARSFGNSQPIMKWNGPFAATVPAGLPGSASQVAPTADVAAATNAFHQAYSAALVATGGARRF